MITPLVSTNYSFPGQNNCYKGKVRDVYTINNDLLIVIVTDRISAFDVVLPRGIPYKGQVLNQIAAHFMEATSTKVPNWMLAIPHPMITVGKVCKPMLVEMVIRGYLSGHAWREYKEGKRKLCGVTLPEGLNENDRLDEPIITPTTKANVGHDEDISKEEIISSGLVDKRHYEIMEDYTRTLFEMGTDMAERMGLILVDTKYEFGLSADNKILLIDEVHTPDSSRYFYSDGYKERQINKQPQRQLSKEFLRQWLIDNDFQGLKGQQVPVMDDEIVNAVSQRYIELYEKITGKAFAPFISSGNLENEIEKNVVKFLSS